MDCSPTGVPVEWLDLTSTLVVAQLSSRADETQLQGVPGPVVLAGNNAGQFVFTSLPNSQ